MFQPPLSPGLLWYKVYIYSKSNPHKIVTNLAQKIRFWKILSRKIGPRIPPFGNQFFTNQTPPTGSQNRAPNSTNRAPILVFQQTSILHSKLQFWVTSTTDRFNNSLKKKLIDLLILNLIVTFIKKQFSFYKLDYSW